MACGPTASSSAPVGAHCRPCLPWCLFAALLHWPLLLPARHVSMLELPVGAATAQEIIAILVVQLLTWHLIAPSPPPRCPRPVLLHEEPQAGRCHVLLRGDEAAGHCTRRELASSWAGQPGELMGVSWGPVSRALLPACSPPNVCMFDICVHWPFPCHSWFPTVPTLPAPLNRRRRPTAAPLAHAGERDTWARRLS